MKIRMLISISGTVNGQLWVPRGEIMDIDKRTALEMISNGQAEAVTMETSSVDPVTETAVKPTAKPRKVTPSE